MEINWDFFSEWMVLRKEVNILICILEDRSGYSMMNCLKRGGKDGKSGSKNHDLS